MKTTAISVSSVNSYRLPALSEHTLVRYFHFIALYIAQGIPEGMVFFGIPAWMAMNGKTAGEIGSFVAAAGLPWSFKIVLAPMMDRFSYLPMGRRRPWVLFGQLGLILSFIVLAFVPDPLNNMKWMMLAGFAIGFFGAFQDVATDGMAIDIIPVYQQARANGLMWGAKIIGTSLSLALGTWLLHRYNFTSAILLLSIGTALIMLVPLLFRERPGEKMLPWTKGKSSPETKQLQLTKWSDIIGSLFRVFRLRNSLLLACCGFFMLVACNYIDTLWPIFTVQALGWTDKLYAQYFSTASLTGGITGMLIGGFLIDRFGKKRMLSAYCILFILLSSVLVLAKTYWVHKGFITAFMVIFQVLYVFSSIGFFAAAMECCWKKVSATQFTLYMTISNLGRITGAKLIGVLKLHFSWEICILFFSALFLLVLILLQFLHIKTQVSKIAILEAKDHLPKQILS
jgi:PAT family beta-lactamase induction signal transducer AmpG